MGTLKDVADWLDTTVTTDLGLSCIKGFPGWDRPDATPPYAAIVWDTDEPTEPVRLGKAVDVVHDTFTLYITAANEVALWALLDLARTMTRTRTRATINSQTMTVRFSSFSRLFRPGDVEVIESLRYAAQSTVTFKFSQ